MSDLFDQIESKQRVDASNTVADQGGDLFAQAGMPMPSQGDFKEDAVHENPSFDMDAYYRDMNESMSGVDKFLVGAGRGMNTIGRAVGLVDREEPVVTGAANNLTENSYAAMAGEIAGEAAPFLPLAPLMGGGLATTSGGKVLIPAAQKLLTRVGLSGIMGIAEGSAIASGKGGDANQVLVSGGVGGAIAGASEILLPVLGRLGGRVFRKLKRRPKGPLLTPEGNPSDELVGALDEVGMTFDDLTDDAIDYIADNQDKILRPAEIARKSNFDAENIPHTKGDISQAFKDQSSEERLMSMMDSTTGEPLRQQKLAQSTALQSRIEEVVDSLGVPSETGSSIKSALIGRKKVLGKSKNRLYKQIFEAAPEVKSIPVFTDGIKKAMPDADLIDDISITAPESVKAYRTALARFGLDDSERAIKILESQEIAPQPLTVGNYDRLRKLIGNIERTDQTGAIKVLTGPVKQALDSEMDTLGAVIEGVGGGADLIAKAKSARSIVRGMKTEYSPQSIVGRLTDLKRDGYTPVVEASRVVRDLKSKPVENLGAVVKSLSQSGKKGKVAINNLRASVILDALNDSLNAPSRKISGIPTISGGQFHKSLKKFGDDKLEVLFRGNKDAMATLRRIERVALDTQPASAATPKGSAPVILDMMSRLSSVPMVSEVVGLLKTATRSGTDRRGVLRAINAKPEMKKVVGVIRAEFPAIAVALGVTALDESENKDVANEQ